MRGRERAVDITYMTSDEPTKGRMAPKIDWRVRVFKDKDSEVFASNLERVLNEFTQENFGVSNFIMREEDGALVVVFHRSTLVPVISEVPDGEAGPTSN
jgi:hypothetical protein